MHAYVSHTSADTHGWPLHQEPLDLPPGVFQVQTLRHKLQRLERLVFVRSLLYLHSRPKRVPCSSLCGLEALSMQAGSKRFQTITSLIRRDAFSANISLPSFHKNWSLIGREKLHCWYWHNRAMAMSVKSCIKVHWLRQVSGQGSVFASSSSSSSKTGSIGVRLCLETFHCQSLEDGSEGQGKSHAAVVAGNVGSVALEVIGFSTVVSWRNLRAFACGNSKANRDF